MQSTPTRAGAQQACEPTGIIVHGDARQPGHSFHCRRGYTTARLFWSSATLAQHLKRYAETLQLARLVGREPNCCGNIITETVFDGVEPTVEVAYQLAMSAREGSWPR